MEQEPQQDMEPEIQPELEPDEPVMDETVLDETPAPPEKPAALTIVIQSWATPIVGILMLIVGLFGGYYLYPLFSPDQLPRTVTESPPSELDDVHLPTPTTDPNRASQQQELMNAVVERTRHFLGDPNAPVTIIEFSDYQ